MVLSRGWISLGRVHLCGFGLDSSTIDVKLTVLTGSPLIGGASPEHWKLIESVAIGCSQFLHGNETSEPLARAHVHEVCVHFRIDLGLELREREVVVEGRAPLELNESVGFEGRDWVWLVGLVCSAHNNRFALWTGTVDVLSHNSYRVVCTRRKTSESELSRRL